MTPSIEARTFEHVADWLGTVADAAAEGEVLSEQEFDDGYVISTCWPTRAAYLVHVRDIWTIGAMVAEDRRARLQGRH